MPEIKPPSTIKEMPLSLIKNMMVLAASGFGVIVALAWNDLIRAFVAAYIDPYVGKSGTLLSLLIYAVIITAVAVIVTMQLSYVQRKIEDVNEKMAKREEARKAKNAAVIEQQKQKPS